MRFALHQGVGLVIWSEVFERTFHVIQFSSDFLGTLANKRQSLAGYTDRSSLWHGAHYKESAEAELSEQQLKRNMKRLNTYTFSSSLLKTCQMSLIL